MSKKFHFTPELDILILKQILNDLPFVSPFGEREKKWKTCADSLRMAGIELEVRTLKERFLRLHQQFKNEDRKSLERSGTNQQYTEKIDLLTRINEICSDYNSQLKEKKISKEFLSQTAREMRNNCLQRIQSENIAGSNENLSDSSFYPNSPSPLAKRKKNEMADFLEIIKAKNSVQQENINQELKIREMEALYNFQKLELEKQKFEEEKKKVEFERQKFEEEKKNSEKKDELIAKQLEILERLLNKT